MNRLYLFEATHLASGDYDTLLDKSKFDAGCGLTSDCGTLEEHLKRNSCPKKHGDIGDCHYELYTQQEIIVNGTEEDAEMKLTLRKKIDEHLGKLKVSEFNAQDFEIEMVSSMETTEPESVSDMKIVHEKLYYNNEMEKGEEKK